jgi:hypothetical protein
MTTPADKKGRATPERLAAAFAAAPLGVVLPLVALMAWNVAPTQWFDGGPNPLIGFAVLFGFTYVIGAALLPIYFLLERFGQRSWKVYVPIAAAAGVPVGLLMNGPAPWRYGLALAVLCAVVGAMCAAVFSAVLAWRPNRREQATRQTRP